MKFGIGQVVFGDIKTVTAYKTHLVEILVPHFLYKGKLRKTIRRKKY
jgi:hypothetical protein